MTHVPLRAVLVNEKNDWPTGYANGGAGNVWSNKNLLSRAAAQGERPATPLPAALAPLQSQEASSTMRAGWIRHSPRTAISLLAPKHEFDSVRLGS